MSTTSSTDEIRIVGLSKTFGDQPAVSDISFSFRKGNVHGFIGPNGAGKTTTMRILATIDHPTAGDAFIMGKSIVNSPYEVRRRISFVPDWFAGFSHATVHEYIDFFARAYKIPARQRDMTIAEIEDFTGLSDLRDKLITKLSRGMQQRVCLARALVHDPDVLLMDEPAANLDPRARIELRELVHALSERNKAILISSHILSELTEMCDSVTIIEKGEILASGPITEVAKLSNPLKTILLRSVSDPATVEKSLLESPGITGVIREGNYFRFGFEGHDDDIAALLGTLVAQRGISIVEFKVREDNLESIFMNITGKERKNAVSKNAS